MAINLDTEVASSFDPVTRVCTYTIERNGQSWTVQIPLVDLERHGALPGSIKKRREHLARLLEAKMNGPPDAA